MRIYHKRNEGHDIIISKNNKQEKDITILHNSTILLLDWTVQIRVKRLILVISIIHLQYHNIINFY